jgi:type IV fimbrial biogenesis protein FimT
LAASANPAGFTLVELLVALAIGAMLLLLGLPSFMTFMRNSEIRSTAESIVNGLRTAAAEAARRNVPVTFAIKGGGDAAWTGWEITYRDEQDATQTIQAYSMKEGGGNTTLAIAPLGKNSVIFTELGRIAKQGTKDDHLQQIDIGSAVSSDVRRLRIVIDDVGKADPTKRHGIRMCDPDPALAAMSDPRAC